ncbi:hypothetical protein BGZ61DRAFT_451484 [Ilyonectria robusta]|uniref:uncharacterized protein n=1 Tax=Ilyonectria robusta TaxID=1079257 RepID=UPI001E8E0465|nr:uncharacterized protein BGZ61DRAFT_451484 [Ilyonectria robusta]KAH8699875.1 hypothetical protein BGZ61DRAFT_451484 [Ilyonectria robusta]
MARMKCNRNLSRPHRLCGRPPAMATGSVWRNSNWHTPSGRVGPVDGKTLSILHPTLPLVASRRTLAIRT